MAPAQQKQAGVELPTGASGHVSAQSQRCARAACAVSGPYWYVWTDTWERGQGQRPTRGSSGVTWQAQLGLRCHWNCPNFGNVIRRPPTLQRSSPTACQAVLARQQPAGWGMQVCPNTTSRYKALNGINITETSATAFSIASESRLWCCWSCHVPQTVKQNHTGNIMLKVYSRSHYKICRIVNC